MPPSIIMVFTLLIVHLCIHFFSIDPTSNTGVQGGEIQIIIRAEGKQAIINRDTGQLVDFYEGTSLNGFIEIVEVK